MKTLPRSASVLSLLAAALVAPAQTYAVSHTFVTGDPTEAARLFIDGNPSQFPGNVKPYPGSVAQTDPYGTFTIPPVAFARVFNAVCTSTGAPGNVLSSVFFSAYTTSFSPASLATNYLADSGIAAAINFSFFDPANTPIVIVYNGPTDVFSPYGTTAHVTLYPTPEPSVLAALGLGAVAALRRRKRA